MRDRDAVDSFMDGAHWALFFLEARLEHLDPQARASLDKAIKEVRSSLMRSRASREITVQGRN